MNLTEIYQIVNIAMSIAIVLFCLYMVISIRRLIVNVSDTLLRAFKPSNVINEAPLDGDIPQEEIEYLRVRPNTTEYYFVEIYLPTKTLSFSRGFNEVVEIYIWGNSVGIRMLSGETKVYSEFPFMICSRQVQQPEIKEEAQA